MRRTLFLATANLVAVSLVANQAAAQLRQPDAFRTVAFEYDSYFTQDVPSQSPSDRVGAANGQPTPAANGYTAPPAAQGGGYVPSCASGCATGCGSCAACCGRGYGGLRGWLPGPNPCFGSLLPCCNDGEPWKLFNPCCDKWSFGGWFNGGVVTNTHGHWNNGPVPFISTNDLLLNQLWAYAEREADNGGYGLDFGGRVDYVFGADGPDTQAFGDGGWDFGWNSAGEGTPFHTYGSAIPQLYASVAYNDLNVKVGRFFTIIGYEVVPAPDNFFYTHAYTMNYGEPFTHTGALGEYAYSNDTTLYGGYVSGWDSGWENLNDANMVIGGITLDWWQDASLAYAFTAGDQGYNLGSLGDLYMHSLVLTYELTNAWTYVLQSDLGLAENIAGVGDAQWYGLNSYLFYAINDCWSFGVRSEWFRDEDGFRITGNPLDAGNWFDVTAGLNYKPNANVVIRPEVRVDWFDASNDAVAQRPFDGGVEDEQLSFGVDAIFLY